jgi:hypothetical protein
MKSKTSKSKPGVVASKALLHMESKQDLVNFVPARRLQAR